MPKIMPHVLFGGVEWAVKIIVVSVFRRPQNPRLDSMLNKSYPLDMCMNITADGSNHEVAGPLTFALFSSMLCC